MTKNYFRQKKFDDLKKSVILDRIPERLWAFLCPFELFLCLKGVKEDCLFKFKALYRELSLFISPVIGIATAWPLLLSWRAFTGAGRGALFFFGFCVVAWGDFPTPLSLEASSTAVGFGGGALFFFLLSTIFLEILTFYFSISTLCVPVCAATNFIRVPERKS